MNAPPPDCRNLPFDRVESCGYFDLYMAGSLPTAHFLSQKSHGKGASGAWKRVSTKEQGRSTKEIAIRNR